MIEKLHIKNIGIIDDLEVDFNKGLNVLTGETGAGKTLIIDSLNIICGGRFSKEMIRRGETYSYVEMNLFIPESEYSVDGNIIISREINSSGRNMCKINGRMVTVNELKDFLKNYIEIHGQNDTQDLLNIKSQMQYLDGYIGNELSVLKEKYKEYYMQYNKIKKELKENYGDEIERERKIDLLKYQFNEIEVANLKIDEEEALEEKRKIIMNSEKIAKNLEEADMAISDNTIDLLSTAIRALEKIEQIDKKYEESANSLKNVYYELQEISRDISYYKEDTYFDEEERNEIETRLDLLCSLKRKYGNSIKEILEYKENVENEIDRIENLEEYTNKLKSELKEIKNNMEILSKKMNEIRKKYSIELSSEINKILKELEMRNAIIDIHVDYNEEVFFETGKDIVKFYICTNLGEDSKELSKIASGGEMSRIMLAIKTVLAKIDKMPIMVFDEIDTGISGKAANAVAKNMKKIAEKHQIMCISHLPNIAAMADHNYFISKKVSNERTSTNIKLLKEDEVINEIARISSGEINEAALKYAYELRNKKVS